MRSAALPATLDGRNGGRSARRTGVEPVAHETSPALSTVIPDGPDTSEKVGAGDPLAANW